MELFLFNDDTRLVKHINILDRILSGPHAMLCSPLAINFPSQ